MSHSAKGQPCPPSGRSLTSHEIAQRYEQASDLIDRLDKSLQASLADHPTVLTHARCTVTDVRSIMLGLAYNERYKLLPASDEPASDASMPEPLTDVLQ